MALLVPDDQVHRKFSDGQLASLREAHCRRRGTNKQFAAEHGMSKATLYRLLKSNWHYASLAAAAAWMAVLASSFGVHTGPGL